MGPGKGCCGAWCNPVDCWDDATLICCCLCSTRLLILSVSLLSYTYANFSSLSKSSAKDDV